MKRDFIKTTICVFIVMIALVVVFFIIGNAKYGIELLTTKQLDYKDPTVKVLYDRIKDKTDLRKASLVTSEMSSKEIIEYVLDNMTKDDYSSKTVKPEKIICEVTKTIRFTSNKSCKIVVIKNDVFNKYQKKLFNTELELSFDDIKYHGYDCKNNGEKYYCMKYDYKDTVLGYSSYDSAYEKEITLSFDRNKMMEDIDFSKEDMDSAKKTFENIESYTLEDIENFSTNEHIESYYYTYNISLNVFCQLLLFAAYKFVSQAGIYLWCLR